jgi:hypothetical protein
MKRANQNCTGMDAKLAELLLDPDAVSAKVRTHVEACDRCRRELETLRTTMSLLDAWEGPEPSPYFLTRLNARLGEERTAAPAGWWERLRARFAYGPQTHVRPLAAMALTMMLLLGGGTYLGLNDWDQTATPSGQAAVVHDLQTMESNAQLLDQLEALSSNDNGN